MSKMRTLFRSFLFLFSVMCIVSCEFSTDEVYERDVNRDVQPPVLSVIDLSLEHDTVFLLGKPQPSWISFGFSSSNQPIKAVRFLIDGAEIKTIYSTTGGFYYEYEYLDEGIHKLDLQIITGSGTGSLAEALGMEGFVFYKSWTLVIDKSIDEELNHSLLNGLLQLSWKRYPDYDFKEYIIYRFVPNIGRIEIARTTSSVFTDSTYVGEEGSFTVEVCRKNNKVLPWGYLNLQNEIPGISLTETEPGVYLIQWDESKYYNAVDSINLCIMYNNHPYYVIVKSAVDKNDYSYYINDAAFNTTIYAKIAVVNRDNILFVKNCLSSFESSERSITVGTLFKPSGTNLSGLYQTGQDEFVYSVGTDKMARYSVTQKEAVDYLTSTGCTEGNFFYMASSASGKFSTSYNLCGYQVLLASSGSLQQNAIYDLKPFSGQQYVPSIPVSDIKTAIVNKVTGGFYIYDFKTSSSLAYYGKTGSGCKGMKISTEGNYIFLSDDSLRLVKFENSTFTQVWSHDRYDYALKIYDFHGLNPDQLVTWDGSTFSVRLCSDFSAVYEFPLTDQDILSIDYYNNRILAFSEGHLFVRSLSDGSLIKDIPVYFDPLYYYYRCILVKNAIVCYSGYLYYYE